MSSSLRFKFLYAIAAAAVCWGKDSNLCEIFDSNMGATFDVTDLIR